MNDMRQRNSDWDPLAEMAKADAARGVPRFSPALHARVMKAARSGRQSPEASESLSLTPFAIVAVMLIGSMFVARFYFAAHTNVATAPPEETAPRVQQLVLNTPPLRATLASWGQQESALEADLGPTQLAGLDHDARIAARYVLDPLSFPSRQQK